MKFLFSLIPLYGLLGLILVVMIGTGQFDHRFVGDGYIFITFISSLFIGLFGLVSPIVTVFTHLNDLSYIQRKIEVIKNCKTHRTAIKEHIKTVTNIASTLDAELLVKSNIDHPVVKAMDELVSAEDSLTYARNELAAYKGKIAARKRGPFKWVVNLYGEE